MMVEGKCLTYDDIEASTIVYGAKLRFVERDGIRILQQQTCSLSNGKTKWVDVPLEEEN